MLRLNCMEQLKYPKISKHVQKGVLCLSVISSTCNPIVIWEAICFIKSIAL